VPNVTNLRKVLDHLDSLPNQMKYLTAHLLSQEEEPPENWQELDAWNQHVYTNTHEGCEITDQGVVNAQGVKCGTAACLAGWGALLLCPVGTKLDGDSVKLPDKGARWRSIHHLMRLPEYFDLTEAQAEHLFHADNTREGMHAQLGKWEKQEGLGK
jgi:hypothetical protein